MNTSPFNNAGHSSANTETEPDTATGTKIDVVVTGRNVEVSASYRAHVAGKLARLGKYTHRVIRYDVELSHENNPRQSKACHRVEITGTGNGPTERAESVGPDFYAALDTAITKVAERLRRGHDRLRAHHGRHRRTSVAAATAPLAAALCADLRQRQHTSSTNPPG
jgi:ribosomal subunit interface protein